MNLDLLTKMYSATAKCLAIAEKISCVEDIKKSMIYENLISNLLLIRDIEAKLDSETKSALSEINWNKFDEYDKQIISDLHELSHKTIFKIIKEELPDLQIKLEKFIFTR